MTCSYFDVSKTYFILRNIAFCIPILWEYNRIRTLLQIYSHFAHFYVSATQCRLRNPAVNFFHILFITFLLLTLLIRHYLIVQFTCIKTIKMRF